MLREDTTQVRQTTGRYAAIEVLAFSCVASDNSTDVWRRIDVADGIIDKKIGILKGATTSTHFLMATINEQLRFI